MQRQRTQLEADVAKLAKDRKALEAERDRLAKRLSGALGEVAQVNETARGMVLNLSGEILFDTGKSKLKKEAEMRLAKLSGILLMMGTDFRPFMVCYVFWVPWDRVGRWIAARAEDVPGRWL